MSESPKPSYKERERQRREAEIVQTAAHLLHERGYANLNMDDLAETVGISKPTLYAHFRSKDELVVRVIESSFTHIDAYLSQPTEGTPLVCLAQFMGRMMRTQWVLGGMLGQPTPELFRLLRDTPTLATQRERVKAWLHDLIDRAKASGELDEGFPTPLVAQVLFCLQGALKPPGVTESAPLTEEELDSRIALVVRMFLHGVARNPPGVDPVHD